VKRNISKKLAQLLASQDIQWITTLKKNMKAQSIHAFDKLLRRKRSIIEAINLKKSFDPRKTQKARKYSKRYQVVYHHPKGE